MQEWVIFAYHVSLSLPILKQGLLHHGSFPFSAKSILNWPSLNSICVTGEHRQSCKPASEVLSTAAENRLSEEWISSLTAGIRVSGSS